MGGEWTPCAYSKATSDAKTLNYGVQSIIALWAPASSRVHSASIRGTPTKFKALCGHWGILTTKIKPACLHPATMAVDLMTLGGRHR